MPLKGENQFIGRGNAGAVDADTEKRLQESVEEVIRLKRELKRMENSAAEEKEKWVRVVVVSIQTQSIRKHGPR